MKKSRRVHFLIQVRVKFSSEMENDDDVNNDDDVGGGNNNNLDDEVEQLRLKDQVLKEFKVNLDLTK